MEDDSDEVSDTHIHEVMKLAISLDGALISDSASARQ